MLSCAGARSASPSRFPLRASDGFGQFGSRLGGRLQQPSQDRIASLRNLAVAIASLVTHAGEDSMSSRPPKPDDRPSAPRRRKAKSKKQSGVETAERRTLRDLAKEIPDGQRLYDVLIGLDRPHANEIGASDRYAAIIGASLLEHALKTAITAYLRLDLNELKTAKFRHEIFDDYERSPLGSLGSRILIAYALGIINEDTRRNLDILRNIRNAFAHSVSTVEFTSPECLREIIKIIPQPGIYKGPWQQWSPRRKFASLTFIYCHALFAHSFSMIQRPAPLSFS